MATGDIKWFSRALLDLGTKKHDLSADTFKLGIITSAVTLVIGTADPRWGSGGSTDLSSNQVATGGTAYTGPVTLTGVTWTEVSNVPTFRANDVVLAMDASGFTNGRRGVIYNDTDAGKRAICFIDFGSDKSLVVGSLTINFGGAGTDVLRITQA